MVHLYTYSHIMLATVLVALISLTTAAGCNRYKMYHLTYKRHQQSALDMNTCGDVSMTNSLDCEETLEMKEIEENNSADKPSSWPKTPTYHNTGGESPFSTLTSHERAMAPKQLSSGVPNSPPPYVPKQTPMLPPMKSPNFKQKQPPNAFLPGSSSLPLAHQVTSQNEGTFFTSSDPSESEQMQVPITFCSSQQT